MCFSGELFPNEKIPEKKWGKVLLNLMVMETEKREGEKESGGDQYMRRRS